MEDDHHLVIDVEGLSKSFQGKPAVVDVDLQVKRGEIFGFLGPNGSGKTTTIRMLCGLLIPDKGKGQCLGYDILTQSYAIKRKVGYMAQRFSLYEELSVYENLDFIASIYEVPDKRECVEKWIDYLGLLQRQTQLAGELSGGMKQRVALAAALLHDPNLLLLDEPTAGVDPKARREFWDHVHQLSKQGITTLVSTHYMDEAERCHRLAYILKGKIVMRGTAEEIISKSQLITYEVRGSHLAELAEHLRKESGVTQVISYGLFLHVSSKDGAVLENLVQRYPKFTWQLIPTSLEDIFVNLAGQDEEELPL